MQARSVMTKPSCRGPRADCCTAFLQCPILHPHALSHLPSFSQMTAGKLPARRKLSRLSLPSDQPLSLSFILLHLCLSLTPKYPPSIAFSILQITDSPSLEFKLLFPKDGEMETGLEAPLLHLPAPWPLCPDIPQVQRTAQHLSAERLKPPWLVVALRNETTTNHF